MNKNYFDMMPYSLKHLWRALFLICILNAGSSFAQSPGGVTASLTGWFKSTSTAGTAASNPLMLNSLANNQVASWMSVGGTTSGSYAVTQAVTSRMPVYQTGTTSTANFNFNPFIQFSNANNTLLSNISSSVDLLGSQGSVFIVVNTYTNTIPKNTALTYLFSTSRWQFKPGFRTQTGDGVAGSTGDYYNTAPYPAGVGTTSYPETSGIILLGKGVDTGTASNNFSAKRNGGTAGITNTYDNVYNPAVVTGFYLGSNNGGEVFNGAVAEVITYNTNLSDADVNKVESYLAVKYGVTLTTGQSLTNANYTAPDGSAFWNADNVYKYNVTGIGREDTSGLYQKQSKSVHNNALVTVYNKDTGTTFPVTNAANTTTVDASTSYFMTADNGLDNTVVAGNCVNRIARVWKVQKTGGIADVTIAAAKSELPLDIQYLVVSSSPAFPAGDITTYELEDTGTIVYKNVNIPTGYYFTYGSDHVVSASPIAIGCEITTTTLTATGLGSWTADAGNPAATVIASPASNSTAVSGFSLPGVYNFNWGSPECFETVAITFSGATPLPPVTIPITYCQGQTALPLTATALAGHTITWLDANSNPLPSSPVPDTSVTGTVQYFVVQTSPGGCESPVAMLSVTVISPVLAVAGFTLPDALCSSSANVLPVKLTGFTEGGSFTAIPTGLLIDATTGGINLSDSMPGTYTVTYTIAEDLANCLTGAEHAEIITISSALALVEATPLVLCAENSDGFATFNLMVAGTQVTGGQIGFTITFHPTLADAQNASATIAAPEAYVSQTGSVFIRVTQTGDTTSCYSVKEISLTVQPRPQVPSITDYSLCATNAQTAVFDLTTKNAEVSGGSPGVTVTYFTNQNDADNNTSSIAAPETFTNTANPQMIYLRLSVGNCYSTAAFNIIVLEAPELAVDLSLDGCSPFDLTTIEIEVPAGFALQYYITEPDALNATNAIAAPENYLLSVSAATIYLRAENASGCFDVAPIALTSGACLIQRGISPGDTDYNNSFDLSQHNVRKISIFSRYGQEVYSFTGDYTTQWHGQTNSGDELPTGTYFYMFERTAGESKTGWIYINRLN